LIGSTGIEENRSIKAHGSEHGIGLEIWMGGTIRYLRAAHLWIAFWRQGRKDLHSIPWAAWESAFIPGQIGSSSG
jgi:hypothetical protein